MLRGVINKTDVLIIPKSQLVTMPSDQVLILGLTTPLEVCLY